MLCTNSSFGFCDDASASPVTIILTASSEVSYHVLVYGNRGYGLGMERTRRDLNHGHIIFFTTGRLPRRGYLNIMLLNPTRLQ